MLGMEPFKFHAGFIAVGRRVAFFQIAFGNVRWSIIESNMRFFHPVGPVPHKRRYLRSGFVEFDVRLISSGFYRVYDATGHEARSGVRRASLPSFLTKTRLEYDGLAEAVGCWRARSRMWNNDIISGEYALCWCQLQN